MPTAEPYAKRTSQGMVLGSDGEKMSKSRGNVVNPDQVVEEYGADGFRVYEMFIGPFDQTIPWDPKGVVGVRRFLEKVWQFYQNSESETAGQSDSRLENLGHRTIKKVTEDIENMRFNTAVSALMILINEFVKSGRATVELKKIFLILLAPFAPHLAEELWRRAGHQESIFLEKWPDYDQNKIKEESAEFVIQVNGKVRGKLIRPAAAGQEEVEAAARKLENVSKYLVGHRARKVIFVPGRLINFVV